MPTNVTPIFPGGIAGDSQLKVAGNNLQTNLAGSIGAGDTILTLTSPLGFVANMLISIDKEILSVSSVVGAALTVIRGFDGTTASGHAQGAKVSGFIEAWHHNVLAAEIAAIEAALGTNLSNVPSSISGAFVASVFNFSVNPPASITVGANVITLTPVPKGVNGADIGHYLYISGGTGTPEAVLITGGSAVSGAASGTIIFSAVRTHSGAYSISSASGGLQEALMLANAGTGGIVRITAPIAVHAQITIPVNANFGSFIIEGIGQAANPGGVALYRATDYPVGDILLFDQTLAVGGSAVVIRDLSIYNGGAFGFWVNNTSGAAIHIRASTALPFTTRNVNVNSGYVGWDVDGSLGFTIDNCTYTYQNPVYTFPSLAAIRVRYTGAGFLPEGAITNNVLVAVSLTSLLSFGILVGWADGINIQGNHVGFMNDLMAFTVTTNTQIDTLQICDNEFDTANTNIVHFFSDGGTPLFVSYIIFADNHMLGGVNGHGFLIDTNCNVQNLQVSGNRIGRNGLCGIAVAGTNAVSGAVTISGNLIFDNNTGNIANQAGIKLYAASTVTNYLITANHILNSSVFGFQQFGVYLPNAGISGSTITSNDFHSPAGSVAQTPISINGAIASTVIRTNGGVDDVTPAIASASTLAFPINQNFTITGTTGVTAVTMTAVPAGSTGTFRTTSGAVTFSAGGGIGNTITTAQNVPVTWIYDGTLLWLK